MVGFTAPVFTFRESIDAHDLSFSPPSLPSVPSGTGGVKSPNSVAVAAMRSSVMSWITASSPMAFSHMFV